MYCTIVQYGVLVHVHAHTYGEACGRLRGTFGSPASPAIIAKYIHTHMIHNELMKPLWRLSY